MARCPTTRAAKAAGLAVDNGIVVDECGRTSDGSIFAAGDVTNHPSPLFERRLRLELFHNAMAQAKAVAQAIAGKPVPYAEVPWFWSDQYDLKLQIAGVGEPEDELILRGDPAGRSFSALHLRARRLVAIDCINRGADFLAAKKIIAEPSADRPRPGGRSRGPARGAVMRPLPGAGRPDDYEERLGSLGRRSLTRAVHAQRLPKRALDVLIKADQPFAEQDLVQLARDRLAEFGRYDQCRQPVTGPGVAKSRRLHGDVVTLAQDPNALHDQHHAIQLELHLGERDQPAGAAHGLDVGHREGDDRGRRLGHCRDLQNRY